MIFYARVCFAIHVWQAHDEMPLNRKNIRLLWSNDAIAVVFVLVEHCLATTYVLEAGLME